MEEGMVLMVVYNKLQVTHHPLLHATPKLSHSTQYLCRLGAVLFLDIGFLGDAILLQKRVELVIASHLHLLQLILTPCIHTNRPVVVGKGKANAISFVCLPSHANRRTSQSSDARQAHDASRCIPGT